MKKQIILLVIVFIILLTATLFIQSSWRMKPVVYPDCNETTRIPTVDIELPFTCMTPIRAGEPDAVVVVYDNSGSGAIRVSQNKKVTFSLDGTENEYTDIANYYNDTPTLAWAALEFIDITYDGYNDLSVLTGAGAYNFTHTYFAYNPTTHSFDREALLEVVDPYFDETEQTITSYSKGRGIGDTYVQELYKFIGGKYILIESQEQNPVDWEHEEKGYVLIYKELKDGVMVETKREYLTYEDVMGYPYEVEQE